MNEALISRIRQCANLPSLPTIAMQVVELAQREDVDIAEIARIISKDPALSTKILRTVNSSFYGRSQNVSTISHALVILGLQSVKTLVLGFSLVTNLAKSRSKGFKHVVYWKRSICSATAARVIAHRTNLLQQEEAFLGALLKDIGMLVLDQVLGEQYGELHARAKNHEELVLLEQEELGATHAEIGGVLAEQWKLPPVLSIPIACHHNPAQASDPQLRRLAEVALLSGRCADIFVDEDAAGAIAIVRQQCRAQFNIGEADCDAMLDEIGKRAREVASLFEINIGSHVDYETILKRANEALVDITLQSQQQASVLQQQNIQLKVAATTDALTGLANRAYFDAFIAEHFDIALRCQKALAVLMIDVDRFKLINDTHGHSTGDAVLRSLGMLFKTAARSGDLAARYGGEEMVMVLPNTTRTTAAAIAETIRRAIAARPVKLDAGTVAVTASIGVATMEPGDPFRQSGQLLKAADLAVYHAKHSGRNCVRVFNLKPSHKAA